MLMGRLGVARWPASGASPPATQTLRSRRHERTTRSNPSRPTAEAIVINMSTTSRLVANGDGELPGAVPARNQGAAVAIDPHQTAAAAVMTGIDTATTMASEPATLT